MADSVSPSIHQDIFRAPAIKPQAFNVTVCRCGGDPKAFEDFCPDAFGVPDDVVLDLDGGVQELINLTQTTLIPILFTKYKASAGIAQINGYYVPCEVHASSFGDP